METGTGYLFVPASGFKGTKWNKEGTRDKERRETKRRQTTSMEFGIGKERGVDGVRGRIKGKDKERANEQVAIRGTNKEGKNDACQNVQPPAVAYHKIRACMCINGRLSTMLSSVIGILARMRRSPLTRPHSIRSYAHACTHTLHAYHPRIRNHTPLVICTLIRRTYRVDYQVGLSSSGAAAHLQAR